MNLLHNMNMNAFCLLSKCSKEWLQHAVHCGDIGRLIEPLLITMLNPSSRRISVHYASLWETITREDEADTVSQDILSDSENDQVYQGFCKMFLFSFL